MSLSDIQIETLSRSHEPPNLESWLLIPGDARQRQLDETEAAIFPIPPKLTQKSASSGTLQPSEGVNVWSKIPQAFHARGIGNPEVFCIVLMVLMNLGPNFHPRITR